MHLIISAIFGVLYYVITVFFGFDPSSVIVMATYVFLLWLSMLFLH